MDASKIDLKELGKIISSPEEQEMQHLQAKLLRKQFAIVKQGYKQQQKLMPFFLHQAGLMAKKVIGKNGKEFTRYVLNPQAQKEKNRRDEIQKLLDQRTLAALKGNLPVDPGLERDLARQETTLRDRLQSQFGPGYETSTPGIETLDNFFKTAEGLRYGARTGQLSLSEQLGLANAEGENAGNIGAANVLRSGFIGDPLAFATASGQTAAGFGSATSPYLQKGALTLQALMANMQSENAFKGGLGNLAGTVIGALFP